MMVNTYDFLKSEEGQGMVEYALIIALISIAVVIVLGTLGEKLVNRLDKVESLVSHTPG